MTTNTSIVSPFGIDANIEEMVKLMILLMPPLLFLSFSNPLFYLSPFDINGKG
jgi:hypothetical protein